MLALAAQHDCAYVYDPAVDGDEVGRIGQGGFFGEMALIDGADKWMAACGVSIVYDGETVAAPNALVNGRPDLANVVGWQVPPTHWAPVLENSEAPLR